MADSALSLLGLALRGSHLAVGEEPVREACKTRRARLVLTAADAADNSADRARRWAEEGGAVWTRVPWDKAALGGALGRSDCAMAALTEGGLAAALAGKLAGLDARYRPLVQRLAEEPSGRPETRKTKNARARRPAVPET